MDDADHAIRRNAPRLEAYVAYSGTMIGYGRYGYKCASGHEGECPIVAHSSRAQYISLYVAGCRNSRINAEATKANW